MTNTRQPRAAFASRMQPSPTEPAGSSAYLNRSLTMSNVPTTSMNSSGWITFTYIQFAAACLMAALGVFFLPIDIQTKGYIVMANVFLIGSTFTLAKTIRDEHENKKLATRIEDARTEKLLMEVGR
jgi:hypothetical protein